MSNVFIWILIAILMGAFFGFVCERLEDIDVRLAVLDSQMAGTYDIDDQ